MDEGYNEGQGVLNIVLSNDRATFSRTTNDELATYKQIIKMHYTTLFITLPDARVIALDEEYLTELLNAKK